MTFQSSTAADFRSIEDLVRTEIEGQTPIQRASYVLSVAHAPMVAAALSMRTNIPASQLTEVLAPLIASGGIKIQELPGNRVTYFWTSKKPPEHCVPKPTTRQETQQESGQARKMFRTPTSARMPFREPARTRRPVTLNIVVDKNTTPRTQVITALRQCPQGLTLESLQDHLPHLNPDAIRNLAKMFRQEEIMTVANDKTLHMVA